MPILDGHERCYEKNEFIFDRVHYLPLLERKPGGLDGAMPFTSWELPDSFQTLRRYLEARDGSAGKREYVLILQLLRDFRVSEVKRAIEKVLGYNCVSLEAINSCCFHPGNHHLKRYRFQLRGWRGCQGFTLPTLILPVTGTF